MRFNQPPQSPVTNVHDACIFPMLSKCLSTEQAIRFNARLLVGQQIKEAVNRIYFDPKNLLAMSRAFAANHQIALAILHHKGDNKYLNERKGMSFGVRKTFMKNPNGNGVVVFEKAPSAELQTENEFGLPEVQANKLPALVLSVGLVGMPPFAILMLLPAYPNIPVSVALFAATNAILFKVPLKL